MKPIVIKTNLIKSPVKGAMVFPFVLIRKGMISTVTEEVTINHETIHFQQALELLVIPFYIIYGINYIINLFKYEAYPAYRKIIFEVEAHDNEDKLTYLKTRKRYNWLP